MRNLFNEYSFLWFCRILFSIQICFSAYSVADTKCKELKRELKSRRVDLTSSVVHRKFTQIERLMVQKDKEEETLSRIEELEEVVKNRIYSLARLYRLKAQVYSSMEKFQEAFEYYNKVIALNKLSYDDHISVLYDIARFYLYQDNLNKAEEIVEQIFCLTDKVAGALYILKATILNEKKQIKPALEMAMKAIESVSRPPESWMVLAARLHWEEENYVSAAKLLTTLTARYPDNKTYWKDLSSVNQNIDKGNKAASTLDLAHKLDKGLERESEILRLARLLNAQEQPFKAAKLIEKFMKQKKIKSTKKNYKALGEYWNRANEVKRALSAYEKAYRVASKSSKKDWKLPAKIGEMYYRQEEWSKAVEYFNKALAVEGVKNKEDLLYYVGYALYRLNKCQEATQSLEVVITIKGATSQSIKKARQLIDFISIKCLSQNNETTE